MFSYLKLCLLSLNFTRSRIYSGAIPFKYLKVSKAMVCILPMCKVVVFIRLSNSSYDDW